MVGKEAGLAGFGLTRVRVCLKQTDQRAQNTGLKKYS